MTLSMINRKRVTPRHVIVKMLKGKDRILKAARGRLLITYRELQRDDHLTCREIQWTLEVSDEALVQMLKVKNKTVNQESYIHQNYLSKFKAK